MTTSFNSNLSSTDQYSSYLSPNGSETLQTAGQLTNATIGATSTDSLNGTTSILITLEYVIDGRTVTYTAGLGNPQLPHPNDIDNIPNGRPLQTLNPNGNAIRIINEAYDGYVKAGVAQYIADHPDLTEEQIASLITALQTGVVSDDMADIFEGISTQATAATIAAFNLNPTWTKGTIDPLALTPLTMDKIPSDNGNLFDQIMNNVIQTYDDIAAAAQNVLSGLGGGEDTATIVQFLKTVGEAIQALKAQLRNLQLADAEQIQKAHTAKFGELEDKKDLFKKHEAERAEMKAKAAEAEKLREVMKHLGPALSVLATFAGILLTIATLGLGSPAAVAIIMVGVAVGAAMTAYSIADSELGLTQKVIEAFNEMVEDLVPVPPNSELDQKIAKGVIVGVIALAGAVLVIGMMATGSGAGLVSNIAAQATSQIVQMAVKEGVKQIVLQMIMMFVMSSNAIPELIGEIMKQSGASKEAIMAVQIVVMVLTMLAFVGMMAKAGKSALSQIANQTNTVVQTSTRATQSAVRRAVETVVQEVMDAIKGMIDKIKQLIKSLQSMLPASVIQKLDDAVHTTFEFARKNEGLISALAAGSPCLAQGIGGAIQGKLLLDVRDILIRQGETESAQQLLQELIQLLEKLIQNIQTGMTDREDMISKLATTFADLFKGGSNLNIAQATVLSSRG